MPCRYEVTFKVTGNGKRVTDLVARMLVDCDRDGYTESFLIAPNGSWPIKNGKVSGKRTDRFDQSKATVELKGSFKGGTFKGFCPRGGFRRGERHRLRHARAEVHRQAGLTEQPRGALAAAGTPGRRGPTPTRSSRAAST